MGGMPFAMVPLPAERSTEKPRCKGLTMMMDWGLPVNQQREWLDLVAPHVDLAKFVVGTARLYDEDYLVEKINLYKTCSVHPFIGGQFLEYVYATQGLQGARPFFLEAKRLGFDAIEVSDNVVPLDSNERQTLIRTAVDCGLEVHGEVGSKSENTGADTLIAQANECFEAGADVVLVEGAELLTDGEPNRSVISALRDGLDVNKVVFELIGPWIPGTHHCDVYALKKFYIEEFGPDVNIANVMPDQVWETETLRAGLSVTGPPDTATDSN
ncbi:MAG: phosphosulfolactate synthase [Pseudomonadota bacterium]|nr:phosphosulfolactate synthase [Pseudomonadota bacterium]